MRKIVVRLRLLPFTFMPGRCRSAHTELKTDLLPNVRCQH